MNAEKAFFDTNVLVYANATGDPRQGVAADLLFRGGRISVQVLNEFAVSLRKRRLPWSEMIEALRLFQLLLGAPLPVDFRTHLQALQISHEHGYHIYDSLIVASAIDAGCDILYTEDLHDGHVIGDLTIRNPFR